MSRYTVRKRAAKLLSVINKQDTGFFKFLGTYKVELVPIYKIKANALCKRCNNITGIQVTEAVLNGEGKKSCGCINKDISKEAKEKEASIIKEIRKEGYKVKKKTKEHFYLLKCPKGHLVTMSTYNIKYGQRCKICLKRQTDSRGAREVALHLSKLGLVYTKEKSYDDLKYINKLKYDFFIPKLNLLIEYDGAQHFRPSFGKTVEDKQNNLEITQLRDSLKDKYAKEHNIHLLRIPYSCPNIYKLIKEYITKLRK